MKQMIKTREAPEALGSYSQAIKLGNTVYLSGQIPLNPTHIEDSMPTEIEEQIRRVFRNLGAVAKAAGGSLDEIVKLTVFLMNISDSAKVNAIMPEFFTEPYPARSSIQVAGLPKGAKIEIEAVMVTAPSNGAVISSSHA